MPSANFIQEAIFKAVDVILEKRLKALQVNYCITVIIESGPHIDENENVYYMINYQDMLVKAYPVTTSEPSFKLERIGDEEEVIAKPAYKKGDLVYLLIINGDFNKKKIILSKI